VIATPVFHRWHHTAAERGGEKNFAATFPLLDMMFGTFYMPAGVLPDRYGIDDKEFPTTFAAQLAHPSRAKPPIARHRLRSASVFASIVEARRSLLVAGPDPAMQTFVIALWIVAKKLRQVCISFTNLR
jgi:hypothetical protein